MKKGNAFILVGNRNWGKSMTLRKLTNNNRYIRRITIKSHEFYIRRMSNCDIPNSFYDFIESLNPYLRPYIITTLCLYFDNPLMKTKDLLNKLYEKYNMYFFVLKYKYHGDNEEIINMEISKLKQFGQVAVFDKINVEAEVRAKYFKDFIKQRI